MNAATLMCWAFADRHSAREAAERACENGAAAICLSTCLRNEIFVLGGQVSLGGRCIASGTDAAERLFAICAGMLSNIPGEQAVADQVRRALRAAQRRSQASARLSKLVRSALRVGADLRARVRESTPILELPDVILCEISDLNRRSEVLIVGRGRLSTTIWDRFIQCGFESVRQVPFADLAELLQAETFDLVIGATSTRHDSMPCTVRATQKVLDVSCPPVLVNADLKLDGLVERHERMLLPQRETLARVAHRIPALADAALAEAVSPGISHQALAIGKFKAEVIAAELSRLTPILSQLPSHEAEKIRRAIRHTAARCVHPIHEYVNQLGRQARADEAQDVVDHLLGSRVGYSRPAKDPDRHIGRRSQRSSGDAS